MISKELLNVVMPQFNFSDDMTMDENELVFLKDGEMHSDINIYELAHKCKEWAWEENRTNIWSSLDGENYCIARINSLEKKEFYSPTEPEAIFKACECILKETKWL